MVSIENLNNVASYLHDYHESYYEMNSEMVTEKNVSRLDHIGI